MSAQDTCAKLALVFNQLGSGIPDPKLQSLLFEQASELLTELEQYLITSTGWTAPTGALSRATFDPATVTLGQLAQRVAALLTDLLAKGDLGP